MLTRQQNPVDGPMPAMAAIAELRLLPESGPKLHVGFQLAAAGRNMAEKGWFADIVASWQHHRMSERYEPPSEFLKMIVADEVPIGTTGFASENLSRLIDMTRDQDPANRDWATMLLAQQKIDTEAVRSALLQAVRDDNDAVRAEALLGLAKRDPTLALPYAQQALAAESASMPVFEAVEIIASPALIPALQPWLDESENDYIDDWARLAMQACVRGASKFSNES